MSGEPTTAGIAVSNIVYDETPKRGPARMRFAPPLAFTIPWRGDVPIKGEHDCFVIQAIHDYAKSLTGKAAITFDWGVEAAR